MNYTKIDLDATIRAITEFNDRLALIYRKYKSAQIENREFDLTPTLAADISWLEAHFAKLITQLENQTNANRERTQNAKRSN